LAEIERIRAPFAAPHQWRVEPVTAAKARGETRTIRNPSRIDEVVGEVVDANASTVAEAVGIAAAAQPAWAAVPVSQRADVLRRVAGLYETNAGEFFALAARE